LIIFRLLGFFLVLFATNLSLAQQATPPGYVSTPASTDGIGKRYMDREISGVMGWQGATWLERDKREREERTDLLLNFLALRPGMVVADIGAGTGYLSRRMAPLVVPGGKIIALDLQPEMISILQTTVNRSGLKQIEVKQGSVDNIKLPKNSIDMAIMVDVYHEHKAEDIRVPIKPLHKMSEAQIKREAGIFPLDWERTVSTLPWQHVVVFRKRE